MYPGSLKQNRMFRLCKGRGLSMEKIHHHVLQFVDGTQEIYGDRFSALDAVRSSSSPRNSSSSEIRCSMSSANSSFWLII